MRIAGLFVPGAAAGPPPSPDPDPSPGSRAVRSAAMRIDAEHESAQGVEGSDGPAESRGAAAGSRINHFLHATEGRKHGAAAGAAVGGRADALVSPFATSAGANEASPCSARSTQSWRPDVSGIGLTRVGLARVGSESSGGRSEAASQSDQERWESAEGSSAGVRPGLGLGSVFLPGERSSGNSATSTTGGSTAGSAAGSEPNPDPSPDPSIPAQLQLFSLDEDGHESGAGGGSESGLEPGRAPSDGGFSPAMMLTPNSDPMTHTLETAAGVRAGFGKSPDSRTASAAASGPARAAAASPASGRAVAGAPAANQIKLKDQLTLELVRCRAVGPAWRELEEAGAAASGLGFSDGPAGPMVVDALVLDVSHFLLRLPLADPAPEPGQAPHPAQSLKITPGWGGWRPARPRGGAPAPAAGLGPGDIQAAPLLLWRQLTLQVAGLGLRPPAEAARASGAPSGESGVLASGPRLLTFASVPLLQLAVLKTPAGGKGPANKPMGDGLAECPSYRLEVDPVAAAADPGQLQLLCAAALWAPSNMAHILGRAAEQQAPQAQDPQPSPTPRPSRSGSREDAKPASGAFSVEARVASVALSLRGCDALDSSDYPHPKSNPPESGTAPAALVVHMAPLHATLSRGCAAAARGGGANLHPDAQGTGAAEAQGVTALAVSWGEARLRLVGASGGARASSRGDPRAGGGAAAEPAVAAAFGASQVPLHDIL